MEFINRIEFECDTCDIDTVSLGRSYAKVKITANYSNEEQIMESLNFEDVMNYYGVSKVCEWCEANR